jgi:MOSC domain-containing protein YiiM
MAYVLAVCISENKGERKKTVESVELRENHGIVGDAHAGDWHRQVSLLAQESIDKMRALGLDVSAGDFAENITTSGIDLVSLPIGTRLQIGDTLLEVTQIGKECHTRCSIFFQAGDCVMPKEGIFVKVIAGGVVRPGDEIVSQPRTKIQMIQADI